MTQRIHTPAQWRNVNNTLQNKTIGLVPSMGNLHAGHISLLKRSQTENDVTVLSCFVNPTQFNHANDWQNYPRTDQKDWALCQAEGTDYLFSPQYDAIYPDNYRYCITEKKYPNLMEGKHRPGHFDGVLTIVLKLLLLIKPTRAYFGEKDYQQLQWVQGMAEAFFLETKIIPCATVRNAAGLALSSRNRRLTKKQMAIAPYFFTSLSSPFSCQEITEILQNKGFKVEYIEEHQGRRFGAVWLGDVRLIDNVEVPTC